jgi:hypothetical protein
MLTGPAVILTLKVAVGAVTVLLLGSLLALRRGNYRLHGQINIVFFILTALALVGLELIVRLIDPAVFDYFSEAERQNLRIHLCFSLPATSALPVMLFTGKTHRRQVHLYLAGVFSVLWAGTFLTGIFLL